MKYMRILALSQHTDDDLRGGATLVHLNSIHYICVYQHSFLDAQVMACVAVHLHFGPQTEAVKHSGIYEAITELLDQEGAPSVPKPGAIREALRGVSEALSTALKK